MKKYTSLAISLVFAAGCASAPAPKKVVAKPKKVFKPAHTVEEIQAAFDEGVKAMQAGDLDTAKDGFKAALKAQPRFPAAKFNLGLIYETQGDLAAAEGEYRSAMDLLPDEQRGALLMQLSKLYLKQPERLNDAESALQTLLAKDPENLVVKHNLAVLYRKQKDYDTALKFLKEILAREAKNIAALNELGLLYLDQKNLSMAQWILGKAIQFSKEKPNADVLNNMGLMWMAKGETPGAVQMFEKALAANPNHLSARKNLGALYVQYLNFEGAQAHYSAVLTTNPHDMESRLGLATSLFGMSQFDPAIAEYQKIIDQTGGNPRNPSEKAYLAKTHFQMGRLYQEFLRDQPKALTAYKEWILHGNPPANHPKLKEIQLLEDMVRRGIKEAATAAEQEKADKEKRKAEAAAKAAEAKAKGLDLDAPPEPEPGAEGTPVPADPNAPPVPADPNAAPPAPADPNAPPPPADPNAAPPAAAPPAAAPPAAAPPAAPEAAAPAAGGA